MKYVFSIIFLFITSCFNCQIQASLSTPETPLQKRWFEAITAGNESAIKEILISDNIDVNTKNKAGETALSRAAFLGLDNIVRILLAVPGIDVNSRDSGGTVLDKAYIAGHERVFGTLLQAPGIDINLKNEDDQGLTILMEATRSNGQSYVQSLLLHPNIDVNVQDNKGFTVLMHAIYENRPQIVDLLIKMPTLNINLKNRFKRTALNESARLDRLNIVQLLLEVPGIKLTIKRKFGTMVIPATERLIMAKINKLTDEAFEKMSLLAQAPDETTRKLHLNRFKSIVDQIGVDDITDAEGNTLLDKAFLYNIPELIFYILQHAKKPKKLLARFPFELINPTSDTFKFFLDLPFECQNSLVLGPPQLARSMIIKKWSIKCKLCKKPAIKYCSVCKAAYYCCRDCQKADWPTHKLACKKSGTGVE